MKKSSLIRPVILCGMMLLIPFQVRAQEAEADSLQVSGEASLVLKASDNAEDSAKFNEYRDIRQGVTGDVNLLIEKKDQYYFRLDGQGIGLGDQRLEFEGNYWGTFKFDVIYDKIPHNYAFGVPTLYLGTGSDRLTLNDALQQEMQDTPIQDRADRLKSFFNEAVYGDIGFNRDALKTQLEFPLLEPFNLRIEIGREDSEGTQPYAGAFGLSNLVEIAEPIDYETTQLKVLGEYAQKAAYLSASYTLSIFNNNGDTLTFDNPLRATDSPFSGPEAGRHDLAPDNLYQALSFTGSMRDLPLNSTIAATASWGQMTQDEDLIPYTSNSAIRTSSGANASDPGSLPRQQVEAKVNTSLYYLKLTSRPLSFMNVTGKLRHYAYDNDTERITFPGYVSADAFWIGDEINNLPTSYKKTLAGLDVGFDLAKRTRLNLGYTFDQTRRTNREVDRQQDNIFLGSIDTKPLEWMAVRASYEWTARDISDYNYTVFEETGSPSSQLPLLRKYDQADFIRNRIQLLVSLYPLEALTVSGSYTYGQDDFDDSPYGLQDDRHHIYSLDADYAVTDRLSCNAFYSYEKYRNQQQARQWFPTADDPFGSESGDWSAENTDEVNTIGGGIRFQLIPKRLDLDVRYSYSKATGDIEFASPLGGAEDPNPYVPAAFPEVDDTKFHTLNAKLKYAFGKGFSVTLGYLWEKFDYDDFNTQGFTNVPADDAGLYKGALLSGTFPEDYNVNVFYTKLSYRF